MSECLRTDDWKYARYFDRTEDQDDDGLIRRTLDDHEQRHQSTFEDEEPVYEELFDLATDPNETTNLATDVDHQERIATMRSQPNERLYERYR
jgi:hypothetical protein